MKKFLKNVMRPTLWPMTSALAIVFVFFLSIVPFMAKFPIFYQELMFFFPAYSINFETDKNQKSIFLIGGSRYREVTLNAQTITTLLKDKMQTNEVNFNNLSVPSLIYSEEMALINQSHYEKGSIALIGVDIGHLGGSIAKNEARFGEFRLGFVKYNEVIPDLNKLGMNLKQPYFALSYDRYWLKALSEKLSLHTLLTQNWHEPDFKYTRPADFGHANEAKMAQQLIGYPKKLARINFLQGRKLLIATVRLAQSKGYKVYLFETPLPTKSRKFNKPYSGEYEENIRYVMDKTGVEIIHANNDVLSDEDFYDLLHLNEFGRGKYKTVFVGQLASAIKASWQ
jgi:hypothetical protein